MLIQVLWVAAALVLLTAGSGLLVSGATALAVRWGVPSFFVGMTIVGFGTSTPELVASVGAALRGVDGIAVGNVVGSNIFNLAVVLGLVAVVRPVSVHVETVKREVKIVILAALVPFLAFLAGGELGRVCGSILVIALVIHVARGLRRGRGEPLDALPLGSPGVVGCALRVVAGLALLTGGSPLLVDAASTLARELGVSDLVIGLTIVSAGTSAPELITSIVAAFRGEADIAVGNVLGSNVFNILGVLGTTCAIVPQTMGDQVLLFDTPVMVGLSLILLPIVVSDARISRAEGAVLFFVYVAYVVMLFSFVPSWFA